MKLPQTLLALGLSFMAMADISKECKGSKATVDGLGPRPSGTANPSVLSIQCKAQWDWKLDLNQCFLYGQDGKLHYYDNGGAFGSYLINKDNEKYITDLAVQNLGLTKDGIPECHGHAASTGAR